MYEALKKNYSHKKLTITTDDYGEEVKSYIVQGSVSMFISLSNEAVVQSSGFDLTQCSHVGLTNSTALSKGDIVADKYEVQFVNQAGAENIIMMKEVESNGCFS